MKMRGLIISRRRSLTRRVAMGRDYALIGLRLRRD